MKIRSLIAISALGSMLFVQTGFAATAAAVLNSAGAVQVNGRNVPSTTPVFAGDKLQTNDQSTGTVSVADTSLQIHPGSNVVYSNDSLEVVKGAATVKTAKAYRAMVHGLSVRPEAAASEFTVQADASKVTISALKGSLAVGSHIKVPQGQTLVLAATPSAAQSGCVDNHKTDADGKFLLDAQGRFINCVDQTTTGGGTTTTTIEDNTQTWTIVTFAATAAAGGLTALIVSGSEKSPVSPAGP